MKDFLKSVDGYIKDMNWKDLAGIKFCVCAAGILLGLAAPKKFRKVMAVVAMIIFVAAFIPTMLKFLEKVCPSCERNA